MTRGDIKNVSFERLRFQSFLTRRPGSDWILIRSCVVNPVVLASLNFDSYLNKGRHKLHHSPWSLHSTSFAHYCPHRNPLPTSPPVDPSQCADKRNFYSRDGSKRCVQDYSSDNKNYCLSNPFISLWWCCFLGSGITPS